ncbi:MAG: hypothetical protein FJ126_11295 [Deltaproteobacteria bacterium]|nr:hypothetical protein [Deltaproteobacteria bacterium]
MIKKLLDRFRRDRGLHKATARIDFYANDLVYPSILWHRSQDPQNDAIPLVVHLYAQVLYELAELNKVQVARQLMEFVEQVRQRLTVPGEEPARRLRLPLGQLQYCTEPPMAPAVRTYQAEFYQLQGDQCRLDFRGSLGKEELYLPGAFLALLQFCLDDLGDEPLRNLVQGLGRLHLYYRCRRDFWEGSSLNTGPAFALGTEELRPEEVK